MEEKKQQQEVVWIQVPISRNAFPYYGIPHSAPSSSTAKYDRRAHAQRRPRDKKGRFVSENPTRKINTWDDGFYNHKTMRLVQDKNKPWVWRRTHDIFTIKDWLILAGLLGLVGWAIIRGLSIL